MKKPSKKVLYGLLQGAIDDVELHINMSMGFLDNERIEQAITRCERAMEAITNAKREIERQSGEIGSRKMSEFDKSLEEMQHRLWRATNKINAASKDQFCHYKRAKNLRLHFLAYSYNPSNSMEGSCETIKIS